VGRPQRLATVRDESVCHVLVTARLCWYRFGIQDVALCSVFFTAANNETKATIMGMVGRDGETELLERRLDVQTTDQWLIYYKATSYLPGHATLVIHKSEPAKPVTSYCKDICYVH
jgi:hypothetical protein